MAQTIKNTIANPFPLHPFWNPITDYKTNTTQDTIANPSPCTPTGTPSLTIQKPQLAQTTQNTITNLIY